MPPMWVHFYGVGVSALAATVLAAAVTWYGARQRDVRTVVVGGGFSLMASLLAVHGLSTPGMVIGQNGLIAVTGAATLPVGGCVMALSALPQFGSARAIPRCSPCSFPSRRRSSSSASLGALDPKPVPGVPAPKSAPAIALFALGLVVYGALAVRATNTFLLTRRAADFAVVLGIVLLACSLYGALILSFMDLGWWLGHIFEMAGLVVVGSSLVFDLRRGRRSRALVGDLRAAELVASEEAYLGARVRALTVRLAVKDASTEEHTRARRDARRADRREARSLPHAPAQPRDRRPAARHRQALDPRSDPAEARPARRRRVRRRQAAPRAWTRAPDRARRLRRRGRAARARPP